MLSKFDRDVLAKALDILEREHKHKAAEELRQVLVERMYDEVTHG